MSGEAPGGEGKTCPGCGGLGWIPAGDEQAGCIDCNGTGHAPAPPSPAVAEGPLPEVPPAATEADALIRLAYDARFGGHEWQRRAHSYLWRDPKPSPAVAEAAEVVRTILTAHDARLSESGALTYGPPSKGTGFVAAIQWLRRYDAARGGE